MIKINPIIVYRCGIGLNLITPTNTVAIIQSPANDAEVIPTGIAFITSDNVNIHKTIVIAVIMLGINTVNPCALFAKPFAAVPKATAIIKII